MDLQVASVFNGGYVKALNENRLVLCPNMINCGYTTLKLISPNGFRFPIPGAPVIHEVDAIICKDDVDSDVELAVDYGNSYYLSYLAKEW